MPSQEDNDDNVNNTLSNNLSVGVEAPTAEVSTTTTQSESIVSKPLRRLPSDVELSEAAARYDQSKKSIMMS